MTENGYPQARHSRIGEVTLWSAAALLMLGVHAGFAYYLMQEPEELDAGGPPPAAIMIEMAAIPEAVKTEETTPAQDVQDAEEVKSDSSEPVEEAAPEEPPPPEPVAETPPPPEPVQPPEPPVEEIVEPQEIPEPVEPVDPVQEQMMAELENVEVPLPVMRPPPPPVEKKVEKKEPEEKKKVERQRPKQQQASELRETAKAEAQQSDRTAASRSNAGSFSSSSMSNADWGAKVRSAMQRRLVRSAGKSGMTITVSFKIDSGGSVGGARIISSTGDSAMDQKLLAVIQRASVSPPPPGANTSFTLPILFK
ncbi:tonB protein [Agrobacterium deltaense Zutra 3/1]|uniref:TonB protein n=1 Tax=Agrobacterium deltaense Zutra 3/1 TaxID=1183427 RepID=A0A1S7QE26_9HYPH|nr:TonB family protein [Agrobacterium deltaense]CUX35081.1 tonB protein [Agrobacterium deltaense Zutra 3/1]